MQANKLSYVAYSVVVKRSKNMKRMYLNINIIAKIAKLLCLVRAT